MPPPAEIITEHGVKFRVAAGSKHKTGFFLDQRDNRRFLASFCAGRRVLDLCCNSGGFAVYAKGMWPALKGREKLRLTWDESAAEKRGTEQLVEEYRAPTTSPSQSDDSRRQPRERPSIVPPLPPLNKPLPQE